MISGWKTVKRNKIIGKILFITGVILLSIGFGFLFYSHIDPDVLMNNYIIVIVCFGLGLFLSGFGAIIWDEARSLQS